MRVLLFSKGFPLLALRKRREEKGCFSDVRELQQLSHETTDLAA